MASKANIDQQALVAFISVNFGEDLVAMLSSLLPKNSILPIPLSPNVLNNTKLVMVGGT